MTKQNFLIGFFLLCIIVSASAQSTETKRFFNTQVQRKGKAFMHWGYNRSGYTKSDIQLKGDDYQFTLKQVKSHDNPSIFSFKEYFSPVSFSIPQYNYGFGYYLTNSLSLSFHVDHMKYVMTQDQTAQIDGYIQQPNNPFNGNYANQDIKLTEDFLTFEHTDGLNYLNFELAHTQEIYSNRKKNFAVEGISGVGIGFLLPKSNVKLFNYPRNDHFHLAGYGASGHLGLKFLFFNKVFLQTNLNGGFINMPDIVTRGGKIKDRAKQHFFFVQENIVLGFMFRIASY